MSTSKTQNCDSADRGSISHNITVDRARAARYGLTAGDVNSIIQLAMAGAVATNVVEADRQFPILVRQCPTHTINADAW